MLLDMSLIMIGLAAACVFGYIAWIDWRTMEIPDRCHLILIGLALLQIPCGSALPLEAREIGLFATSLPMFAANLIRQGSFGGGDIKMCGATGFLLGVSQVVTGTLLALLLAGLYGVVSLLFKTKNPKDSFALGPFLSFGFIASMVFELRWVGLL